MNRFYLFFISSAILLTGCQIWQEEVEEPLYPVATADEVLEIEEQIKEVAKNIDAAAEEFEKLKASMTIDSSEMEDWSKQIEENIEESEEFIGEFDLMLKQAIAKQQEKPAEKPIAKTSQLKAPLGITTTSEEFPLLYRFNGLKGTSYLLDVKHKTDPACAVKTLALPNNYTYTCNKVDYYFLVNTKETTAKEFTFTVRSAPHEDAGEVDETLPPQEMTLTINKAHRPSLYPLQFTYLFKSQDANGDTFAIKMESRKTGACESKTDIISNIITYECEGKSYALRLMEEKEDGRIVVRVVEY